MVPIDTDRQDQLLKKVDRANFGLRITGACALVVLFLTLGFLVVQGFSLQRQLDAQLKSQVETASKNHQRTQQYVRCIANVLMKPLRDRTEADFDACGLSGTTNTGSDTQQQVVIPQQTETQQQAPPAQIPETSTPQPVPEPEVVEPEPTPEEKSQGLRTIPLVDGLLKTIGL